MAISLYDAFVPGCRQILAGLGKLVDKGEAFAAENGAGLIDARLAEDMWPLPWHIRACWLHSAQTLALIPAGEFSPDFTDIPADWAAMRAMLADAASTLAAIEPDALEALVDKPVGFVLGGNRLFDMTGQNFLLSFNQPNFYFHATTFYDILRAQGVPLSKRDFMGPLPIIGA
ncbi:DUF1993 domain-containing protein [Altererythrobacter sp. CAU 1778]